MLVFKICVPILFLSPIINYHILENCLDFQLKYIFDYKLNIVGALKKSKVKHLIVLYTRNKGKN